MLKITDMSLNKKLYQLIIQRLDGNKIESNSYKEFIYSLIEKNIGGFILFNGKVNKIRDFINEMQKHSEIPLFIASDIERGVGQQVHGCTNFPCQMAVAAAINRNLREDILLLEKAVKTIAIEAAYTGINMPLIPVLDVNINPDNPIICTRAFSDEPETVSWFGNEYIKVLEENGMISCAKHFPGHGDTSEDSHLSLPVIKKSIDELISVELKPFIKAIKQGVSSLMVGHLLLSEVDNMPASLSYNLITNLLRKKMCFDGLVLSDALDMKALNGFQNVSALCIKAGVDILLHPSNPDITVKELISGLEMKIISEQLIDNSLSRILRAKQKLGKNTKQKIFAKSHEEISCKLSEKSITFVKNTQGIIPVKKDESIYVILAGDEQYFNECLLRNYFSNVFSLKDFKDIDIKDNKKIIVSIFTCVSAWKGSSGITATQEKYIKNLIRNFSNIIIISFGSPYILRKFMNADILIAAYEPSIQAQKAVLKCLSCKIEASGTLPVAI